MIAAPARPWPSLLAGLLSLVAPSCGGGGGGGGGPAASNVAGAATQAPTGAEGDVAGIHEGLVLLPAEASPSGPSATGHERPYFHSFGRVRNGEVVAHVFRMRNSDERVLTIRDIKPGCGCTVPSVRYLADDGSVVQGRAKAPAGGSLLTVPPGAIVEIELRIDTRSVSTKNSDKTVQTTISTDSPGGYYLKLETHIVVEVPFHLVPNGIHFGRVAVSGGGSGSMEIVQAPGYDLVVGEVLEVPDGVEAELALELAPTGTLWRLTARLLPPLEPGRWSGTVVLATRTADGEPEEPLSIPLQADAVPDLSPHPARLVLVARDASSFGLVTLSSLLPGHRLLALGAEVDPLHRDLLAVALEPVEPDARGTSPSWELRLTAPRPQDVGELLRGHVRVELDDPQHPEVLVPYVVHPGMR